MRILKARQVCGGRQARWRELQRRRQRVPSQNRSVIVRKEAASGGARQAEEVASGAKSGSNEWQTMRTSGKGIWQRAQQRIQNKPRCDGGM